ncbi:type II CRISPR-associated endonuclease Cas1 [[Mycoplasma] mobile]|uniref:CRISPR-associated endonuclease Cas1 n=1 Tax=Mycoplasma mobile (strain ATCC 43663 / 163K / NCTC 11711) TaxID=267748 RepID=Q6KIQ8_MYCM1|nr:type II CRISPR-associated endonuclease Cas1 [[Mycoplasma] mobile]AAT27518.1 conserved expressed putative DNA-repair protein [Mycoplasma mobile 163K]
MGWKIVEINTDEYVHLYLNNLYIKRKNEKILLNIRDIDTILFNNQYSTISIRLLTFLAKNNVNIIFMNEKNEPNSYLIPIEGNHNSLKVVAEQVKWTKEYKAILWKDIIKNKIHNQKNLLIKNKLFNNSEFGIEYFDDLINNVNLFDISNREGHAAKVYWNMTYSKEFIRNNSATKLKFDKFEIVNAILNYGYSILRSSAIQSIIKKGLDPRFSIFHKSFSNFFALASDLIEIFRPLVDEIAYLHKDETFFDVKIKDELINVLNKKVIYKGKYFYVNDTFDQIADNLVNKRSWEWVELWD